MSNEPVHVYLNLDVVNNSTTTAQPLVFNETRNMPFLTNSENYFCSVVRFTLQTSNSLPVFIPDILTGQSDYDKTVYAITMSFTQITTSVPSGEKRKHTLQGSKVRIFNTHDKMLQSPCRVRLPDE